MKKNKFMLIISIFLVFLVTIGITTYLNVKDTSNKNVNMNQNVYEDIVDDKENILYDFSESVVLPSDFRVNDFLFKDINNDGREDFLLILGGITDLELHKAIIYEQNKIGGFEENENKTKKINNKMNETNKYSVWDMFKYLRLSS